MRKLLNNYTCLPMQCRSRGLLGSEVTGEWETLDPATGDTHLTQITIFTSWLKMNFFAAEVFDIESQQRDSDKSNILANTL